MDGADVETQNQAANLASKEDEPRTIIEDFGEDQKLIGQLLLKKKEANGFSMRQATGTIVKKLDDTKYIVLTCANVFTHSNEAKETVNSPIAGG